MSSHSLNNNQIFRAALIVLLGFLTSGVLGLVRLGIVSSVFGTSEAMDAFIAAQRIPEVIFTLVAGGVLGSSFIPVFARVRQNNEAKGWRLASATMTLSALAAFVLAILVFVFADAISENFLMRGRSIETQLLTASLMRPMMLTPIVFAVSGLVMGILQSSGLFFWTSIAISMNNVGLIIGALVIAPLLTPTTDMAQVGNANIYGLAIGAVLSAVLHLLVQLPDLLRLRAPLHFLPDWRVEGVQSVLWLMIPRSIGQGVVQINHVVNLALGSNMATGAIVALNTAFMLMFFALGVIGQSVGVAIFPTLAALYAEGNKEEFKNRLILALRSVLFLAFPAMAVFILLGAPIISIFERGQWTITSTQATAWALAFYAIGIPGFALLEVLSRAFYAIEDTWTPVVVGVLAMISNIVCSLLFIQFIGSPTDLARGAFGGLALANALTTNVEAVILWLVLRRRLGSMKERSLFLAIGRVVVATLVMSVVFVGVTTVLDVQQFIEALIALAVGGLVFFGVAIVLQVEEATVIPRTILKRVRK